MTQRFFGDALDELSKQVIGAAIEVHRHLGPGLLESAYADCLIVELAERGMASEKEVLLPLHYKSVVVNKAYRIDLLVEQSLIVELKACDQLLPVHSAQLLTYLKLTGLQLGLLMNFNHGLMHQGIKRVVNGF
ncbi:GxxExxY protein [Azonexus sp.]|uniref:GxxExxY protein n=1 Tax=Azonexus sp. TaxID=1872668 RepID=UPI0035B188E5